MQLKGKIIIHFLSADGSESKPAHEENNLIFNATLLGILDIEPTTILASSKISISTQNTVPVATNATLTQIIGTGYVPAGVTSPAWYENVNPNFFEITNAINALSTPRTFDTVGLTTLASADQQASLSTTAYCYSLLSITCTQEAFQSLLLRYQIQIIASITQGFTSRFYRDFGGRLCSRKSCRVYYRGTSYASKPIQAYTDPFFFPAYDALIDLNGTGAFLTRWTTQSVISSHYKNKNTRKYTIANSGNPGDTDQYIGKIFNSMLTGLSATETPNGTNFIGSGGTENVSAAYRIERYLPRTVNAVPAKPVFNPPFQMLWWHKSTSTSQPFFDNVQGAAPPGKIAIAGIWSGNWPEIYQYTIGTGGDVGTATYKIRRRYHLGFNGNTWNDVAGVGCPFRNPNTPAAAGMHGWRYEDNDLLKWSDTQIVQYDGTGVTLLNLITGAYTNWDTTTTPALNVTTQRQVAVDPVNGFIYCACRVTGLWRISVVANTITNLVATPCYGVDVGKGNVAYALFEGFFRRSLDWTVNLSITYVGLTDSNWSRGLFLKCDPDPALSNDRMAIVMTSPSTPSTNRRVLWVEVTAGGTVTPTTGLDSSSVPQWAAGLDVSDTGSFWAINSNRLTFNSVSTNTISSACPSRSVTHSVWGSVTLYKVNFFGTSLITVTALRDSANTAINSYTNIPSSATVLHMLGGIIVCSDFLRQLFTDNIYAWENYGWNGSGWELNHAGFKTTHVSADAAIAGLTVAWTSGTPAPSFVAGDFYVQPICNGWLKSNGLDIYDEAYWYSRPVTFDATYSAAIPAAPPYELTFPAASDPSFFRIETDSTSLHQLQVNGADVTFIYVAGESPAAGEVTINGTTGVITFNAANAGQTFNAIRYTWIGS